MSYQSFVLGFEFKFLVLLYFSVSLPDHQDFFEGFY